MVYIETTNHDIYNGHAWPYIHELYKVHINTPSHERSLAMHWLQHELYKDHIEPSHMADIKPMHGPPYTSGTRYI